MKRPTISSRVHRYTRRSVALALLLATAVCTAQATDVPGVAPMEDWARFEDVRYAQGPLDVHLRTGYQRPIIMPEPVRLKTPVNPQTGLVIDTDVEIVILSPQRHFGATTIVLTGLTSGLDYRITLRSSAAGQRIPLNVLP